MTIGEGELQETTVCLIAFTTGKEKLLNKVESFLILKHFWDVVLYKANYLN